MRYYNEELNTVLNALSGGHRCVLVRPDGIIEPNRSEELAARMIECGLARKRAGSIVANIPVFTKVQDDTCRSIISEIGEALASELQALIAEVFEAYRSSTPARLHDQIRGNIGGQMHSLAGMVLGDLEVRGVVAKFVDPAIQVEAIVRERD